MKVGLNLACGREKKGHNCHGAMSFNKIPDDTPETLMLAGGFLTFLALCSLFFSIWTIQHNLLAVIECVAILALVIVAWRKAT